MASKFIGAKFALCDIEGGTVKLSNTRSINCNIINTKAGVNQMADIFKDHFLDIGYTNPYDSTADAVVRRGGGGNQTDRHGILAAARAFVTALGRFGGIGQSQRG